MSCLNSSHDTNKSSSFIFNKTTRAYLLFSALSAILGILIVALSGPRNFDIDGMKFSFCAKADDCSQHLVAYCFAFGLMTTWFLSGMILLIFKSYKFTISKWLFILQIASQIGCTIAGAYMNEIVYKIGYWMFFNAIKYYFLQAVLIVQGLKYIYRTLILQERYKFVFRLNLLSLALFFVFAGLNGWWFFGPRCSNQYDILYVCTVTVNMLGMLLALFDSTFGLFIPLHISTISQVHLFIIFHSSPYAINCGQSPLLKQESWFAWVQFSALLLCLILGTIKILAHITSQSAIPELNMSSSLDARPTQTQIQTQTQTSRQYIPAMTIEKNETLLFDSGVKRNFGTAQQQRHNGGINASSDGTPYSDPFVSKWYDGAEESFSSPQSKLKQSAALPSLGPRYFTLYEIDEIDNETFVEHYFYNPNRYCTSSVRSYFIATFAFSLFIFMLTHFGEHSNSTTLGLLSDHIQWFFVMSSGWQYFIYVWSVLAQNLCPTGQLA